MRSDLPPQTALDRFGRYEWTISVVEIDRGWVQRVAFVQRKRLISTILQVVCGGFFAAVMMLGRRWYMYAAHAGSPYDAVDIALNGDAPEPMRGWGCDTSRAWFPGRLPPSRCRAGGTSLALSHLSIP
ncbi:hypothetical protein [Sphingomonas sp. CFBP 13728]|uniref:hypothetical protein n=1 Tax=Sphingomonas sp. CFBP 13728 TaxID=2775294 RepID=UPI001FD55D91|nr:hypothetical protein [Sphingomonas sp. CFBP 13728]